MPNEKDKYIVLTGATGFLGAFLLAGLLDRGYQVIALGRSSTMKLAERLSNLVTWLNIGPRQRVLPIEVDFTKKHLGLDDKAYSQLCANTAKIIHCASDTRFAERNRQQVMETNISNLASILEFAEDSQAEHFYYISTAYAVGVREGICLETPVSLENNKFTNVYEESKAHAEDIITKGCNKIAMPLSILRPSIVYGHSRTGRALKFNALYYGVKSLSYIKDIFVKDIVEHGGAKSIKWGFNINNDGTLYLPLTVYLPENGAVNLISVDYFVEATIRIMEHGDVGIYNITCDNPPNILTISDYIEKFLGIRGIKTICKPFDNPPNPAEELFGRFFEIYRPYLSDKRIFDRSHTKSVVNDLSTPPLTYDIFDRCMSYAVACDWGKMADFPK